MRSRHGVTLVELLVVIAVIAMLAAIAIPAVQQVRQIAMRMDCANRLHQIGIAVYSYESIFNVLPPAWEDSPQLRLLPHLSSLADSASARPPSLYRCPADRRDDLAVNFAINAGSGRSDTLDDGTLGPVMLPVRMNDISDGLSQTLLFSEWISGRRDPPPAGITGALNCNHCSRTESRSLIFGMIIPAGGYQYDQLVQACEETDPLTAPIYSNWRGTYWRGALSDSFLFTVALSPNKTSCVDPQNGTRPFANTASSRHGSGVNCLFADGSVRFISDSIGRTTWRAIGTRAGAESVSVD